jgi:hypothetical protein
MSHLSDILKQEFEILSKDLVKRHDELGMRASGKWASSHEIEVIEKPERLTATLKAEKYTEQLQFGRKPGRFPPLKAIENWIIDKGFNFDIPIKSLSFLIARKIAKEGTKYYQKGGTDLVDSVVTDERMQDIINKLAPVYGDIIRSGFIEELKKNNSR